MKQLQLIVIAIVVVLCDAILQYFLWYYPAPSGSVVVSDPWLFYKLAIYYSSCFISLCTLPFLLLSLIKKIPQSITYILLSIVLTIYVFLNHADHEYMRQVGTHYAIEMMNTYQLTSDNVLPLVGRVLSSDVRGSYSALWLGLIPLAMLGLLLGFRKKMTQGFEKLGEKIQNRAAAAARHPHVWMRVARFAPCIIAFAIALGVGGSGVALVFKESAKDPGKIVFNPSRRQLKTAPVFLTMIKETTHISRSSLTPDTARPIIERVQNDWIMRSNGRWKFKSPDDPFAKTYVGEKKTSDFYRPKKIIFVVVESLRGMSLPIFNEAETHHAMPFLESIVDGSAEFLSKNGLHSAYWKHYNTNGQPTIDAFFALHTGLIQHTTQTVASAFPNDKLMALPQYLKSHGYETSIFIGGDATLDSQAIWGNRWYDKMDYYIEWDDRLVFNGALDEIVGDDGANLDKSQFSVAWLITNHVDWTLPSDLGVDQSGKTLVEKMYQTMAFDDDELRKFITTLDEKGVLKDAIVVITGDHGYDLGEYEVEKSQVAGLEACRRNVTWIPLVMISNREDMPRGEQLTTASHSDVAPTILSALDIYDDNVFTGHDLWTTNRRITINTKYGNSMIETNDFTAVFSDPVDRLYSTHDYMQRSNVASSHPDVLKELRRLVDDYCAIVDYAYERGMF